MKSFNYVFSIMLSSVIVFNATGSDSVSTLKYLASKAMNPRAFAQKILDGTIDKEELNELKTELLFETLAELVAKELYLLTIPFPYDHEFNELTKHFIPMYFTGVSIQDLLDNNWLPEIKSIEQYLLEHGMPPIEDAENRRIFDLKRENIASLKGYENIPDIQQLHHIDLSQNLIKQLPRDFHLESLVSLDISKNQLQTMPNQFHLPNVEFLNLSWNKLEDYPDSAALPSIIRLIMTNNKLKMVPAISYPQLQRFNVANNQIAHIAEGLRLPKVQGLIVKNNQLSDIPSIGAEQSVVVNWGGNNLTQETKDKIRQRFSEGSVFVP